MQDTIANALHALSACRHAESVRRRHWQMAIVRICTLTSVHVRICVYVYVYVCVHMCMCVCVYV